LSRGIDWVVAWFVNTSVKSIGIEVLALLLSRIREISSLENWSSGRGNSRSTRNSVINARVVVSEFVSTSKPGPLKSPGSVSEVSRHVNRNLAWLDVSVSGSRISTIRVVYVIRLTSTNFVAVDLLNSSIKSGVRVRLRSRSPS